MLRSVVLSLCNYFKAQPLHLLGFHQKRYEQRMKRLPPHVRITARMDRCGDARSEKRPGRRKSGCAANRERLLFGHPVLLARRIVLEMAVRRLRRQPLADCSRIGTRLLRKTLRR
ncbi:MAG TPA: hypothetical protein VHV99_23760 [Paraburkholderia sp.]|nr:hypothetical protein [Paraburkholderia sp.]